MSSNDVPSIHVSQLAGVVDAGSSPLDAPAPAFVSRNSQDLGLPSSRSSFTRVEHDDEQRTAQPASHDTVDPLIALPTLVPTAATITAADTQALSLAVTIPDDHQELKSTPESTSLPELSENEPVPQMPQTYLTFLLISGKRRTMSFEPDTSIGRVKELVWNSWPADWQDDRPPAPSYLRVLYLGRMLQDDETLSNLKLVTYTPQQRPSSPSCPGPTPTIVHLSIRPYPPPGEGDAIKKKKKRVPDEPIPSNEPDVPNDDAGCCRCIIC